jgi:2C-methyl-D-erythritol 2,4-cyclodiphosphate synthase
MGFKKSSRAIFLKAHAVIVSPTNGSILQNVDITIASKQQKC